MHYQPLIPFHRVLLASQIQVDLHFDGFSEVSVPGVFEQIYEKPFQRSDCKIRVFTSIDMRTDPPEIREIGTDAIRIMGLYKKIEPSVWKNNQGKVVTTTESVFAQHNVRRTGEFSEISKRIVSRIKEVQDHLTTAGSLCKCGAPFAWSVRTQKTYCPDACWQNR